MRLGAGTSVLLMMLAVASSNAQDSVDSTTSTTVESARPDSVPSEPSMADTTKPAARNDFKPFTLRLFAPAKFDSLINLLPSSESIRATDRIISVAVDTVSGDIELFTLGTDGEPVRQTFPKSALVAGTSRKRLNQDGRTFFMIWSTAKAAYVYPLAFSSFSTEGRLTGGLSLLALGGTLYGTYLFTENRELGYGRVALMNSGSSLLGISLPLQLQLLLAHGTSLNDDQARDRMSGMYDSTPAPSFRSEAISGATAALGFPLGIYLGSKVRLPGITNADYGKVSVMHYLGVQSSTLHGYMWPMMFFKTDDSTYLAAASAASIGLVPAGYGLGYLLVRDREISSGRGMLVWLTGYMGGLTGLLLPMLSDSDPPQIVSQRVIASSVLTGHLLGSTLGFVLNKDQPYTFWQSAFIGASAAGGAAVALALPLIAQTDRRQPYILAGVAGGWSGLFFGEWLSRRLFEQSAPDGHADIDLAIEAPVATMWPVMVGDHRNAARLFGGTTPVPLVNVHARF